MEKDVVLIELATMRVGGNLKKVLADFGGKLKVGIFTNEHELDDFTSF